MKTLAILILFTTLPQLQAEEVRRTFQLKYTDPRNLVPLITTAHMTFDTALKAVTIVARDNAAMSEAEEIIKRFDVPQPAVQNIDVTIYLMSALGQPAASAVPAELDRACVILDAEFAALRAEGVACARPPVGIMIEVPAAALCAEDFGAAFYSIGSNDLTQYTMAAARDIGSVDGNRTISQVKFRSASISTDEKGRAIRIDSLKVGLKIPIVSPSPDLTGQKQYQYIDTGMSTDVDIREGQKVVVGKANMDGSDRASIVVLMAKVVE